MNILLEQFDGAQGELAAAAGYLTQSLAEEDSGRKFLGNGLPFVKKVDLSPAKKSLAPNTRNG